MWPLQSSISSVDTGTGRSSSLPNIDFLYFNHRTTQLINFSPTNKYKPLQIDYHNTTDFCESIGAKLFETSSKENKGIEELFATIAEDYVEDGKKDPSILVEGETRFGGRSGRKQFGKKKGCCASS